MRIVWTALAALAAAGEAGAGVVISQVYGGGGNAGPPAGLYQNDFVELYNNGAETVDVTGWSVHYGPATETGTWTNSPVVLSGKIARGRYYLVQLYSPSTPAGAPLPAPDATGSFNLAVSGGKVALVSNPAQISGPCPTANVVDVVGWGTSTCAEGTAVAALANDKAALRNDGGCTDSGSNSADFTKGAPNPRNSAIATHLCPGAAACATEDTTCDNVDDDCNGLTDEGFQPTPTACGTGECANTGETSCANGQVKDGCTARPKPALTDTLCNGADDDCDGETDEDTEQPTTCGKGVCAGTGMSSCTGGVPGDTCVQGSPSGIPESTCNGHDDDCDGDTDEEYSPATTTCGVGDCAATGLSSCVGGQAQSSCTPLDPAPDDADCDGADDDCDGEADEDYVPQPVVCGTGVCTATGTSSCEDDGVKYNCTAGVPGAGDADCDGVDEDCDGETDEEFVPQATSCGEGPCASTGSTHCQHGQVVDSCTPRPDGTACPDGDLCNGNETCQGGLCKQAPGAADVVCAVTDECHEAGSCAPDTGLCSNPLKPDGTPCTGGNCQSGLCSPEPPGDGCGCGGAGAVSAAPLALILAALVRRTRSRRGQGRRQARPEAAR